MVGRLEYFAEPLIDLNYLWVAELVTKLSHLNVLLQVDHGDLLDCTLRILAYCAQDELTKAMIEELIVALPLAELQQKLHRL